MAALGSCGVNDLPQASLAEMFIYLVSLKFVRPALGSDYEKKLSIHHVQAREAPLQRFRNLPVRQHPLLPFYGTSYTSCRVSSVTRARLRYRSAGTRVRTGAG